MRRGASSGDATTVALAFDTIASADELAQRHTKSPRDFLCGLGRQSATPEFDRVDGLAREARNRTEGMLRQAAFEPELSDWGIDVLAHTTVRFSGDCGRPLSCASLDVRRLSGLESAVPEDADFLSPSPRLRIRAGRGWWLLPPKIKAARGGAPRW